MGPVAALPALHAPFRCPTGSRGSGSTRRSPGSSGSPAPLRPRSPTPAAWWSTAGSRGKGDRLTAGSWLEVELPPPPGEPVAPRPVEGMTILYDDDDIVVVDKPVGVAAHPSPGWDGPTVIGGLAAAGYRISTSGAAERQGVVHRLDAATTGVMVVAKSERAYTSLKAAFKERTVAKGCHALVQGRPDPCADDRRARSTGTRARLEVRRGQRRAALGHPLRGGGGVSGRQPGRHPAGDRRAHQIRVHFSALRHPCVGDTTFGADPTLAARLGVSGSGCTP